MSSEPAARPVPMPHYVIWLAGAIVAAPIIVFLLIRSDKLWSRGVAEFACPSPGTVFTLSMPLALSAEPGFTDRVLIAEHNGFDCRIHAPSGSNSWLHAGLTDSAQTEWRAAAEELWPLKVGNHSHAHFQSGGQTWAVDYQVVSFEKYVARVGTYDTFKIAGTLTVDGKLVFTTTRWWSPDLHYALSFRLERMIAGGSNIFWEIAGISGRNS